MDDSVPNIRKRESLSTLLIVGVVVGGLLFVLNFLSLGILAYVVGSVLGFVLLGYVHYLMWGYQLARETVGSEPLDADLEASPRDRQSSPSPAIVDMQQRQRIRE